MLTPLCCYRGELPRKYGCLVHMNPRHITVHGEHTHTRYIIFETYLCLKIYTPRWRVGPGLRALAALAKEMDLVASTHKWLTTIFSATSRQINALSWPPWAAGMNVVHTHAGKTLTHIKQLNLKQKLKKHTQACCPFRIQISHLEFNFKWYLVFLFAWSNHSTLGWRAGTWVKKQFVWGLSSRANPCTHPCPKLCIIKRLGLTMASQLGMSHNYQ